MNSRIRFLVLRRDGFRCRYCGAKAPDVQLHVDHVVPRARGGSSDVANLVTACRQCNLGKGTLDVNAAEQLAAVICELDQRNTDAMLRGFEGGSLLEHFRLCGYPVVQATPGISVGKA